jgi:hypothetical protein
MIGHHGFSVGAGTAVLDLSHERKSPIKTRKPIPSLAPGIRMKLQEAHRQQSQSPRTSYN